MARQKIALLYVGGSIGMKVNQRTGRIERLESLHEIYRFLPELQKEVALKFFNITNVGSSDMLPANWTEIAKTIKELYKEFDGFVVVHGTNTMTYTACALSFALQNLSKPVVLTGAILPINDLAGDGRMNLIFAIRAAQLDIAEVCVVLGPRVLRGNRIKKVDHSFYQTFDSPRIPDLADFYPEVKLKEHRFVRRKRSLVCLPEFDANVMIVTLTPGMSLKYLDSILASEPNGIVIQAYGPGMLPKNIFPWIRKVTDAGIPIVITSQQLRGSIELKRYRKQIVLEQFGVISGKDMSFECAVVKLMWALAQHKNSKRIHQIMEKNIAGELSE